MLAKTNWHPKSDEISYFANTLAVLAVIFAVILAVSGKLLPGLVAAAIGLSFALICRFLPIVGRWVYVLWMAVTYVLSLLISPIAIAIIFYIVLTPIAFVARLSGRDELCLKRRATPKTYLKDADCDSSPDSFHRQF